MAAPVHCLPLHITSGYYKVGVRAYSSKGGGLAVGFVLANRPTWLVGGGLGAMIMCVVNIWDYGSTSALFNITQHQAVVKVGVRAYPSKGAGGGGLLWVF